MKRKGSGETGYFFSCYETAMGIGAVLASRLGLVAVVLPRSIGRQELEAELSMTWPELKGENSLTQQAATALRSYFVGERVLFDLAIDSRIFTPFQEKVYGAVAAIPFGTVRNYGEVARQIGVPAAARAVGGALARNPLPIIIPCHRVVAATGALTGFSAPGGIVTKRALLEQEGCVCIRNKVEI